MVTKNEIIEFLNNCQSISDAVKFFNIAYINDIMRKKELEKIISKYGFTLDDLKRETYLKRKREEYYKNPRRCLNCGKVIPYKKRLTHKFCGSSCAASYNNKLLRKKQPKKTRENISKGL